MHHAEALCQRAQSLVERPQVDSRRHQRGCEQQYIHYTATQAEQAFSFDEGQRLAQAGLPGLLQAAEIGQCPHPVGRRAARKLPDDQRMDHHEVELKATH